MSRKYKFHNPDGIYFVSFATVRWVDVFTRPVYCDLLVESLRYCQSHLGMELFSWCIMTNHVHLIFRARQGNPSVVLGRFKEFTAKSVLQAIVEHDQESRKDWLLDLFEEAGLLASNVSHYQFWQHHNQPIELTGEQVTRQKVDYIHQNPEKAGFVCEGHHWRYSSAIDYGGGKGLLDVVCI